VQPSTIVGEPAMVSNPALQRTNTSVATLPQLFAAERQYRYADTRAWKIFEGASTSTSSTSSRWT